MQEAGSLFVLERVLVQETHRLGRAILLRELQEGYQAATGSYNANASTAVKKLVQRKLVVESSGRQRRRVYAHADYPVLMRVDDPVDDLYAVLVAGVAERGHALSTAEVIAQFDRAYPGRCTGAQVGELLDQMWKGTMRDRVWLRKQPDTLGVLRRFWSPPDPSVPLPIVPLNRNDRLRAAIIRATGTLGRPPARHELTEWLRMVRAPLGVRSAAGVEADVTDADVALAAALPDREHGRMLNAVSACDTAAPRKYGGLANVPRQRAVRALEYPWSCQGGTPRRFAIGRITDEQHAQCIVEDLAAILRPADELASLAQLDELATAWRSQVLARFRTLRIRILADRLSEVARTDRRDPESILMWYAQACASAMRTLEALRTWARCPQGPRGKPRYARLGGIEASIIQVKGMNAAARLCLPVLETSDPATAGQGGHAIAVGTAWQSIGGACACRRGALEDLAREALARAGQDEAATQNVLRPARRVRNPDAPRSPKNRGHTSWSLVDRVDALATLTRACHLPRLRPFVEEGLVVLGSVLRDPGLLQSALVELPSHDRRARQALVLALGLMGTVAPAEVACPDPGDGETMAAYLAAVALGVDDADSRVRLAWEADRRAVGAVRRFTNEVLGRIQLGVRLGVLD